jgi:hypothetical protein
MRCGHERPGLVCDGMLLCNLRIGARAMMRKMYAAFIMSFSVALTLACNQASGQPGVQGGVSHSGFHPSVTRSPHHHIRRNIGTFFPAAGGFFWGPSGQPNVEVTQPIPGLISGDRLFTCTYHIPWDWVHRCPPVVSLPEPPPSPIVRTTGCPPQAVTVPGADGKDQTVSMVRC